MPDHPIPHTEFQRAVAYIKNLNLDEVEATTFKINSWKSPGSDGMAAELIKYRGK